MPSEARTPDLAAPRPMAANERRGSAWVTSVVMAGVLCACHDRSAHRDDPAVGGDADSQSAELSYAVPPQVSGATPSANGGVVLTGRASPGATLRLSSPEGEVLTVAVRSTGRWTLRIPPLATPRMFALSASVGDRVVHGEGALLLARRPAPVALLVRTGSGALVIDGAVARPAILAVDCDPGGFCAVSGLARPRAAVRLSLDRTPAGAEQADEHGRYALMAASRRLQPGPHDAVVQTPDGEVRRSFTVTAPDPLRTPYQVTSLQDGWRVEWAIPGGGVQTTLVFAQR